MLKRQIQFKVEKKMQKHVGLLRRCIDDYHMIAPGDRIAVGVSGGKDSLTLLVLLSALREYFPIPYTIEAVSIDLGLPGDSFAGVEELCRRLGVPLTRVKTEIGRVIFEERKEKNPCSLCSRMRRGALSEAIRSRGITKLALGHHYDDAVETFLLCLFYEGRLGCFEPVTYLDRTGVTQIRPMLYLSERSVADFAERYRLPVVQNACPADKNTRRQEIKELIASLSVRFPDLRARIFGAMQRLPLPGWAPENPGRRPLPDIEEAP